MHERLPFCAIRPSKGNGGLMSAHDLARNTMLLLLALSLISYGVRNAHCSSLPGNSTDMLSLLDFKQAITNDPRQALSSWNSSIPHCKWEGVNCSLKHPGRVTALNLSELGLLGLISPSLGNLTFLMTLDLSINSLTGELPPLNHLHKLQQLVLGKNSLHGIIPDSLTNCSNLQYLDLGYNNLTGEILHNIGFLSNLMALELSANNLTGIIPPSLKNISQLEYIFLAENKLTGTIPDEMGQLPNLLGLVLGGNRLSGGIPETLYKYNQSFLRVLDLGINMLGKALPSNFGDALPNLRYLALNYNKFEGHIPASLGNISQLSTLDLSSNNFMGKVPSSLGRLGVLNFLNLQTNELEAKDIQTWEFIGALSNCSSLQILGLAENKFEGAIPNSIGNLPTELQQLGMNANELSGPVPINIGNLEGLTMLDLSNNMLDGPIEGWAGKLRNLIVLTLVGNNFTGQIPSSIGNLTELTSLSLAENEFEGPIPPTFGNVTKLTLLNLSYNNIQGNIPKEIFHTALTICLLSYNNLEGPVPPEISKLPQLNELHLSSNQISGEIPTGLGSCQELTIIEMGHNFLTGSIPMSLGSLPTLKTLNLSHNNLSGFIPIELGGLQQLTQLDLSYNNLEGGVPRNGVFGNAGSVSLRYNRGLCGGILDLPLCPAISRRSETQYYLVRVLIPLFGFTSLVMLTYIIFFGKKTSQRTYSILLSFGKKFPRVAYNDLARATGNFSELNLVGRGSYGSVYRGKLTQAKIQVAIKVFDLDMKCADKSFVTECEVLSRIRHRNLVPILTACSTIDNKGDAFKALIYEFMPNGNLDTWLHNKYSGSSSKCLSTAQRASIAIGIADALAYLHNDCERQIVHCDLKPTNILLDNDFNAYLGDFGIASLIGHSSLDTSKGLKGTIGYIAPEYAQNGQASIRGDVYSFGIVLLEMLICKRPTDPMFENELNIVNFVERNYPDKILDIIDARLRGEHKCYIEANLGEKNAAYECLLSLMQVALSCTHLIPRERMNIREVTNKLHSVRTSYIRATKREQAMLH